jgi:H+/Cl- antiporter ClcA
VENTHTVATTVLVVALLRAMATTAAAAAGGCGGLFVPFLAVGDLAGRVFAPSLHVPEDLAGAAGAACGIAGGYRLPFTAIAVVLGQGGPPLATLTCLAAVAVATFAGTGAAALLDRLLGFGHAYIEKRAHQH